MLKAIWGGKPKTQIGPNADATMWNTGVETPTAVLCGLLATKLVAHKLNPEDANAPLLYEFKLKTTSQAKYAPNKVRITFYRSQLNEVYIIDKMNSRIHTQDVDFNDAEKAVLFKAYSMLQEQAVKIHAAWLVEQNQNKALKLIEGLVE